MIMALVPQRKKALDTEPCDPVPEKPEVGNYIMASVPRRKKHLPRDLYESLNRIVLEIDSYIERFNKEEQRMNEIKEEFCHFGEEIGKLLRNLGLAGVVVGAVALVAAFFTGGLALFGASAGSSVILLGALFALLVTCGYAIKIENQGKNFQSIAQQMGKTLAEIERICDEWEKRSESTVSEDVRELRKLVRQVRSSSAEGQRQTVKINNFLLNILELIAKVLRKSATGKEGKSLCDSLIESSGRCETTISELRSLRKTFMQFKEAATVYDLN